VLPNLAERASSLLGAEPARWQDAGTPLEGTTVAKFEHLMRRVDPERIKAMIDASKDAAA
jgi:methionyl-tRNA synthetase